MTMMFNFIVVRIRTYTTFKRKKIKQIFFTLHVRYAAAAVCIQFTIYKKETLRFISYTSGGNLLDKNETNNKRKIILPRIATI